MGSSNTGVSKALSTLPATCLDTISKNITTVTDFHSFLNTHPNIRSTARPSQYLALAHHAAKEISRGLPLINCIPPCLLPAVDETREEAQKGTRFFTAVVKLIVESYPPSANQARFPFLFLEILSEYVRNNRVNAIDCVVELGLAPATNLFWAAARVGSLSSMKSFVEKFNISWEDVRHSSAFYEVWKREHDEVALYLLEKFPIHREKNHFCGPVSENKLRWIKFLESHGYPIPATYLPELLNNAIERGYEELVEYLLSRGASLTAPNVLNTAIRCPDVSLSINLVRRAIDAGADVRPDMTGTPEGPMWRMWRAFYKVRDPLWQALLYGRADVAEVLVEAGADLQALMGDAAYDIELWMDVGAMAGDACGALKWLLRKGCKPRSEDVGQLLRSAEEWGGGGAPEIVELWQRYQEGRDVTSAPVEGDESTSSTR
ncbi:hypothetical protein HK104_010730 [Borealophlyctis nickersoniae]|nr:hypothetical protein HK104_010730 [Borealophlyctis nickersoniae]